MKLAVSIPSSSPSRNSLARAALCEFLARGPKAGQRGPGDICEKLFPGDKAAMQIITRAVTPAATTTVAGWASELISAAIGEFVSTLPTSAASQLIARGMQVAFAPGVGSVRIPNRLAGPSAAPWVAEADAIPARAWVLSAATLQPKKLGLLVGFSRELAAHSAAETVLTAMLREEAAFSLDSAYFGTQAGSAAALPGLLFGVTPTVLSGTAGAGPSDILRDLGTLAAAANAEPGSSGVTMFVTNPAQAAQLVMVDPYFNGLIFPSAAVPPNRLIAIDPLGIVHGFGGAVIEGSTHATYHESDTPGADISTATPSRSAFQTDFIVLRLLVDVAFTKRRPGAVQFADRDWSP